MKMKDIITIKQNNFLYIKPIMYYNYIIIIMNNITNLKIYYVILIYNIIINEFHN